MRRHAWRDVSTKVVLGVSLWVPPVVLASRHVIILYSHTMPSGTGCKISFRFQKPGPASASAIAQQLFPSAQLSFGPRRLQSRRPHMRRRTPHEQLYSYPPRRFASLRVAPPAPHGWRSPPVPNQRSPPRQTVPLKSTPPAPAATAAPASAPGPPQVSSHLSLVLPSPSPRLSPYPRIRCSPATLSPPLPATQHARKRFMVTILLPAHARRPG